MLILYTVAIEIRNNLLNLGLSLSTLGSVTFAAWNKKIKTPIPFLGLFAAIWWMAWEEWLNLCKVDGRFSWWRRSAFLKTKTLKQCEFRRTPTQKNHIAFAASLLWNTIIGHGGKCGIVFVCVFDVWNAFPCMSFSTQKQKHLWNLR